MKQEPIHKTPAPIPGLRKEMKAVLEAFERAHLAPISPPPREVRPNSELKAVVAILASPVVAAFATKLGEMALARLANLERRDEERHQQALLEGKAHTEESKARAGRVEDERLEKRIHLLRNSEGLPRAVTLALEDWVVKAL